MKLRTALFGLNDKWAFEVNVHCSSKSQIVIIRPTELQGWYNFKCPFCDEDLHVAIICYYQTLIYKCNHHELVIEE